MILYILICVINIINIFPMETISPSIQEKKALAELNSILEHSQKFVKVHAAEYLIWTGHPEAALKEFLKEEKIYSNEPKYRIVIWRVLVQAERDPACKKIWLKKIYDAYKDMDGPDRTHATETLAKLKQPVANQFPQLTAKTLASSDRNLQTYALWASSYGSDIQMDRNRKKFIDLTLTDTNLIIRKISAFVLRQLKGLNLLQWEQLTTVALSSDKADGTYVTFLATSLVTAPAGADSKKLSQINDLLIKDIKNYTVDQRTELSLALAEKGEITHLEILQGFINNDNSSGIYDPSSDEGADLRAAAAYAILKISRRQKYFKMKT
jgi:HEAT repeat protein